VAVLIAAVAVLAAWRKVIVPRREAAHVCDQVRANAAAAPAAVTGSGLAAYILGDSYVTGWTLPDPRRSFAYDLARVERWRATVDGWAGSGYTNPGPCGGHLYAARVIGIPAGTRVVVIEGGLNDLADLASLPASAARVIDVARRRARVVVVIGPPLIPTRDAAEVRRADHILAVAAARAGARYVSLLPVTVPLGPDRTHPTVAGAARLARFIAARLTAPSALRR
jgi:lysophospholipase L1-like esterase